MMRKRLFIKKILCLICVFSMSFCSLAAIVSDNDGSAFVTKAEFDALRNSFYKQIDDYNASIDGKIDGAIASYLAGLSTSEITTVKNIAYLDGDNIMSVQGDTLIPWMEPKPIISIASACTYWQRLSDTNIKTSSFPGRVAATSVGMSNAKPSMAGQIRRISNVRHAEAATGTSPEVKFSARWEGIEESIPVLSMNGLTLINEDGVDNQFANPRYNLFSDGFYPMTDDGTSYSEGLFTLGNATALAKFIMGSRDKDSNVGWSHVHDFTYANASFGTNDAKYVYKNIICTPKSSTASRFCDKVVRNWMNDPDNAGHSAATKMADIYKLDSSFMNGMQFHSGSVAYAWRAILSNEGTYKSITGEDQKHYTIPYEGFVLDCTDWNMLWTNNYDAYFNDMLKYQSLAEINAEQNTPTYDSAADVDGKDKYFLRITAGCPIYEGKADDIVTIDMDFYDKTVDHYVYAKVGTFTHGKNPSEETDLILNGTSHTIEDKAYVIPANNFVPLKITMPKDGFLFIKWGLTKNGGGGEWIPPRNITYSRLKK